MATTTTAKKTAAPKAKPAAKAAPKKTTTAKTATTTTKKPAVKKAATTVKAEMTVPAPAKRTPKQKQTVSAEARYQMICERAYYIAEAHGFDPNRQMQNWLEAEAQINQELA